MSSPEPSGYPHHHHPHPHPHPHHQHHQQQQQPHQPQHHLYGHHPDHHHHHHQLPPVAALPPPPAPPDHLHQGMSGREGYGERTYHYPERRSPFPPPPPPPPPPTLPSHPPAPSHPEPEQPLDLSVSRSPRPSSAGTQDEGGPPGKRPRLEEGSRGEVELGRGDHHHSSVCLVRGCNCRSPMPLQHTPHYSQHRHSPYPQYPMSGHSSPAMPGEVHPYPNPYCISQPSPPSSSSGMLYGGGGGSSSSPYIPPPDRRSHSPGVGMVSYGGEMGVPQRPPSGSLLGPPPPHSTISPLSISTHVRDPSPCPPSQPLARMRDVSPRPFYRPFEDPGHALADMPHAAPVITSSSRMSAMEPYPSEDDLSASSTLLMLSNTTSESRPTVLTRQTADSSADTFTHREHALRREETRPAHAEPSQSDSGRAGVFHRTSSRPTLPSYVPKALPSDDHHLGSREARSEPYPPENQPLGPAQDGTVASTYSSDDLNDSPAPPKHGDKKSKSHPARTDSSSPKQEEKSKKLQSRLVKVVGTTPLATMREQRARKHAEKVKELLEHRSGDGYSASSNDSEGASDLNSSGQASPRSSDGSDNDVGQGFPIPPDPNIKMSALDYLISKVLVERIDVPFKACNTEIQEIYTGAKKGRLTLVDLIELQVEASLKA